MARTHFLSPIVQRGVGILALVLVIFWILRISYPLLVAPSVEDPRVYFLVLYYVLCLTGLIQVLLAKSQSAVTSRFLPFVCGLAMLASVYFLGAFLGTFDSFCGVSYVPEAYLFRGLAFGASFTTVLALRPDRFFSFPRWMTIPVCAIMTGWIFAYAFPSVIREWYGTRTSGGMLVFIRPNPEREVQGVLWLFTVASWIALMLSGRIVILKRRTLSITEPVCLQQEDTKQSQSDIVLPIQENETKIANDLRRQFFWGEENAANIGLTSKTTDWRKTIVLALFICFLIISLLKWRVQNNRHFTFEFGATGQDAAYWVTMAKHNKWVQIIDTDTHSGKVRMSVVPSYTLDDFFRRKSFVTVRRWISDEEAKACALSVYIRTTDYYIKQRMEPTDYYIEYRAVETMKTLRENIATRKRNLGLLLFSAFITGMLCIGFVLSPKITEERGGQ